MDPFDRSSLADELTGAALTFGLLGKILYAFPEKTLFQTLLTEDVFEETPLRSETAEFQTAMAHLQRWSSQQGETLSDAAYQELLLDYTRLFVGANRVSAPLWESVYFNRERMVFQKETMQVRKWHQKYDLQSEQLHHEPDDHLGLELTFLAHLGQLAVNALGEDNDAELVRLLGDQQAFLVEHPLQWVPQWSELVQKYAQTDFYRGIALLVSASLSAVNANLLRILGAELKQDPDE